MTMAGTPYEDVFDQFLMEVKDYRLTDLYESSQEDFSTYLLGWLIPAIDDFSSVCDQSLVRDDDVMEFDETLAETNIVMLAHQMVKYWAKKNLQDIMQMNIFLQDRDFKTHAAANNLNAKESHLNQIIEETSQKLVDYGFQRVDWAEWANGTFYTP
jgi:hypothetical protein